MTNLINCWKLRREPLERDSLRDSFRNTSIPLSTSTRRKRRKRTSPIFAKLRNLLHDGAFDDEQGYNITLPDSAVTHIRKLIKTINHIENWRKPQRGDYDLDEVLPRFFPSSCGKTINISGWSRKIMVPSPYAVAQRIWQTFCKRQSGTNAEAIF